MLLDKVLVYKLFLLFNYINMCVYFDMYQSDGFGVVLVKIFFIVMIVDINIMLSDEYIVIIDVVLFLLGELVGYFGSVNENLVKNVCQCIEDMVDVDFVIFGLRFSDIIYLIYCD